MYAQVSKQVLSWLQAIVALVCIFLVSIGLYNVILGFYAEAALSFVCAFLVAIVFLQTSKEKRIS